MRNFHTWLDFYSHLFTILEAGTYIFQFWWLITFTHFSFADNPSQLQEELNLTKNNNKSSTDCLLSTAGTVNNGIHRKRKESTVGPEALLLWLTKQVESYENVVISDMTVSFQNGLALCAIIHKKKKKPINTQQIYTFLSMKTKMRIDIHIFVRFSTWLQKGSVKKFELNRCHT